MLEDRSKKFSFSTYDWWGAFRGVVVFFILGVAANIDGFEIWLATLNISPFFATMVMWWIVDLGRRFATDYTKKE